MIKLLIVARRCAGKTRAEAIAHLRSIHGPLVYDPPADAGPMPAKYVQNHVVGPAEGVGFKDRDIVTEVWFETFLDLGASTNTPFYKTVLQRDEPNFVDTASVLKGVAREGDLRGIIPGNAGKLFILLKKSPDADSSSFAASCGRAVELAHAEGHAVGFMRNTLMPPPGGGEPFADDVLEFWFSSIADAKEFADRSLAGIMALMAGVIDQTKSFHLLAEEYTVDRLRASARRAA